MPSYDSETAIILIAAFAAVYRWFAVGASAFAVRG